ADTQNANFTGAPTTVIVVSASGTETVVTKGSDDEAAFAARILSAYDAAGEGATLRFRYTYANQVDGGVVTVTFIDGAWVDPLGNPGSAGTQQFAIITQAESFFISLSGGVIL